MFSIVSPVILPKLFPSLIWNKRSRRDKSNRVYLTFDDGPMPGVTEWVLEQLKKYNAKATFFCLGKNVKENPVLFEKILQDGHAVGNHTFNHMKGWNNSTQEYERDIEEASKLIKTNLFRPPYGKIKPWQIWKLKKRYKIIMWDVLSQDYDKTLSPEDCFENIKNFAKPGSIIVFHDSYKAEKNLRGLLPKALEYFSGLNFQMAPITA